LPQLYVVWRCFTVLELACNSSQRQVDFDIILNNMCSDTNDSNPSCGGAPDRLYTNCPICGVGFRESVVAEELSCSYWICDCCGCEYGLDDTPHYRQEWKSKNYPWFNEHLKPPCWNADEQLKHVDPKWNVSR